ncbi:MAG TPA: molybdate ABC transporter substrate-binding protein [Candidatus Limnocylindrales bacterium]|nr:molybdate ABC transporter substrate-binding protein [Candidatus Limnocylindrales bacterium]
MNKKILAVILVVIVVAAVVLGLLAYNGTFTSKSKPTLIVFAASSLTYVIANMTQSFENANNCIIRVNAASSSTLETQITQGSPCDVFMSANIKWNKALNSSGLLYQNYYTNFTKNSLCIILATGNPKNITSLADLAKPGVRIVVADPSVPVGEYANDTIYNIAATWGNSTSPEYVTSGAYVNYPTKFYANVVSYETDDENIVGDVSLNVGTADAGIVFVSDWAYASLTHETVQFLPIPSSVNTFKSYGICVPSEATQKSLAETFMNYWLSAQGQALLTEFGFGS